MSVRCRFRGSEVKWQATGIRCPQLSWGVINTSVKLKGTTTAPSWLSSQRTYSLRLPGNTRVSYHPPAARSRHGSPRIPPCVTPGDRKVFVLLPGAYQAQLALGRRSSVGVSRRRSNATCFVEEAPLEGCTRGSFTSLSSMLSACCQQEKICGSSQCTPSAGADGGEAFEAYTAFALARPCT